MMKKCGIFIGFILGFLIAWLLFKGNDDLGWVTIRDVTLKIVIYLWDKIVFISPYGRITDATDNFLYILNWSTGWSILCFLYCILLLFLDSRKFFLIKAVLSLSYFMIMWYLLYLACFIIIKIPIFFNVLSAIAVSISSIIVGLLLIIPIEEVAPKLNS